MKTRFLRKILSINLSSDLLKRYFTKTTVNTLIMDPKDVPSVKLNNGVLYRS